MFRLANIINSVKKRWVAAPVVIAEPLVLAMRDGAPFTPSATLQLPGTTQIMSRLAVPANVTRRDRPDPRRKPSRT